MLAGRQASDQARCCWCGDASHARAALRTGVRRDQPDGGEHAALDSLTEGRVHVLEVPRNPHQEVQVALDELQRLVGLPINAA